MSLDKLIIGITTCPRVNGEDRLTETVASLRQAGFADDIVVFSEPSDGVVAGDYEIVHRKERLGVNGNWYQTLLDLLDRSTAKTHIMICQDDVRFSAGLRNYMNIHFKSMFKGMYTLYTSGLRFDWSRPVGWNKMVPDPAIGVPGALSFLFPREIAKQLASSVRNNMPDAGAIHIDNEVGKWLGANGYTVQYHLPSLAQHTGDNVSTIYKNVPKNAGRVAPGFVQKIM